MSLIQMKRSNGFSSVQQSKRQRTWAEPDSDEEDAMNLSHLNMGAPIPTATKKWEDVLALKSESVHYYHAHGILAQPCQLKRVLNNKGVPKKAFQEPCLTGREWERMELDGVCNYKSPGTDMLARMGGKTNVVALDIDTKKCGVEIFKWIYEHFTGDQSEKFFNTWVTQTGSGGYHIFFRKDDWCPRGGQRWLTLTVEGTTGKCAFDMQSEKQFLILPPSRHPVTNKTYKFIVAPDETTLKPAPEWLKKLYNQKTFKPNVAPGEGPFWQRKILSVNDQDQEDEKRHVVSTTDPDQTMTVKILRDILTCIGNSDNYDRWTEVIWACQRVGADYSLPANEVFSEVNTWSKQAANYDYDGLQTKWNTARTTGPRVGLKRLMEFAQQDSPDLAKILYNNIYNLVIKDSLASWFECSEDNDDDHLAQFVAQHPRFAGEVRILKHGGGRYRMTYVWNGATKLFEKQEMSLLNLRIAKYIKPILRNRVHEIDRETTEITQDDDSTEEDMKKQLKSLKFRRKAYSSVAYRMAHLAPVKKIIAYLKGYLLVATKLDCSPFDVPIMGGAVVNLKTGKVRERTIEDGFTNEMPVQFLGLDSDFTIIDKFMNELTCNRPELKTYLRRRLGYCLSADVRHQELMFWVGSGSNGKSKLVNIMQSIMGKHFSSTVDKGALIMGRHNDNRNAATNWLTTIRPPVRLGCCNELDEKNVLNAAMVKMIVGGGDSMTARLNHQDTTEVTLTAKIIGVTNELPKVPVGDEALMRRLTAVPFDAHFTTRNPGRGYEPYNPNATKIDTAGKKIKYHFLANMEAVEDMMTKHRSLFFTWIVGGAIDFFAEGPEKWVPRIVRLRIDQLVNEENHVPRFVKTYINFNVNRQQNHTFVPRNGIFKVYKKWCESTLDSGKWQKERSFYKHLREIANERKSGTWGFDCALNWAFINTLFKRDDFATLAQQIYNVTRNRINWSPHFQQDGFINYCSDSTYSRFQEKRRHLSIMFPSKTCSQLFLVVFLK